MAEIAIRNLVKRHGKVQTIHGIDLSIASREFVVILGPSGSGKSTLLRMIAGLEETSEGEIAIDGTIVNRLEPKARGCAMVFQNYALYPHMTVADNIGYALKVSGVPKLERRAKVAQVAETLGLEALLGRRPAQLSGGQRQRVAMGRAMIREPRIFLFDEPLSNLDAKLRVQMRLEIRRLHQRLGTTSIFVTHDQVEAMTLADRLVVMNHGRIEQIDTPAELYRRPANLFVAGFVGSAPMNMFAGRIDKGAVILDDGARFDGLARAAIGPDGDPVQVGIRPEDLEWRPQGGPGTLPFQVELVEELGSSKLVYGTIGGQPATVAMTSSAPAVGARVPVGPKTGSVHLFDARSGARLSAG